MKSQGGMEHHNTDPAEVWRPHRQKEREESGADPSLFGRANFVNLCEGQAPDQ